MDKRKILLFKDIGEISDYAIEKWRVISEQAIAERGYFSVALSGGKTPVDLYRKFALSPDVLPWQKTHIFWVDERFVPFSHPDSNYRIIEDNLLNHIPIPEENIHPVSVVEDALDHTARIYEENLRKFFKLGSGEFPDFDLILLGMGEDGHIASLFPQDESLNESTRLVVSAGSPRVKHQRISLTLPVINSARNAIFLVSGQSKAAVLKKVLEGDIDLPAAMVSPEKGHVLFLIDGEAAAHLF